MSPDESHSKAVQSMTQWVSAIADNIRNPLAGMAAALDIVTRELASRQETGVCDEALIDDACRRMRRRFVSLNEYINELVDFGRPLIISPRTMDLAMWLDALIHAPQWDGRHDDPQVGGIISLSRGQLSLRLGAGVSGAQVSWDAPRMAMALRTLITNGIEAAMGQKTPRVEVSVEKMGSECLYSFAIHIDDNGPGFDPMREGSVFEPFFSTKEAGTGLGLAITRRYVEAHGGTVTLGRAPSLGGARVTLFMPDSVNGSFSNGSFANGSFSNDAFDAESL